MIAAEENMLPVVDELAAGAIGKRRRASTELGTRFEHEHARALLGKHRGGAQPGEAGADDDDVGAGHGRRAVRAQVPAAMSARRGRGIRTTVEKTS